MTSCLVELWTDVEWTLNDCFLRLKATCVTLSRSQLTHLTRPLWDCNWPLTCSSWQGPASLLVAPPAGWVSPDSEDIRGRRTVAGPSCCTLPVPHPAHTQRVYHYPGGCPGQRSWPLTQQISPGSVTYCKNADGLKHSSCHVWLREGHSGTWEMWPFHKWRQWTRTSPSELKLQTYCLVHWCKCLICCICFRK